MTTTPRSAEQLRAIIRTQTEIVSGDLDPETIMQLIAERAQELTRASSGVIELAEGEEMVYAVTSGRGDPIPWHPAAEAHKPLGAERDRRARPAQRRHRH